MHKKRRLSLFVTYTPEDKTAEYVKYLQNSLKDISERVITICQKDNLDSEEMIGDVIFRKNIGYDAGAYQDALLNYIGMEALNEYDELLLVNDSCFGPIFSLEDIFTYMDSKDADFWGMTEYECKDVPIHIQSYFLVYNHNVIISDVFKDFWIKYKACSDRYNSILNFEIGLSQYLIKSGFKCTSYAREKGYINDGSKNTPMFNEPELYIKKYGIPFVKRKIFEVDHYIESKKLLDFIGNNTLYMIDYILEYYEGWLLKPFEKKKFWNFYRDHKRIFIYGKGKVGQGIYQFFHELDVSCIDMFDTSDLENIKFHISDGIIVATIKKEFGEEMLKNLLNMGVLERDILLPEKYVELF